MTDDLQLIVELVTRPRVASGKFVRQYGHYIAALASRYGDYCGADASTHFIEYLKANEWKVFRSWLPQAGEIPLRIFLSRRAEPFFRELRKRLLKEAIQNTPWVDILTRAVKLSRRDQILCFYMYVDGLTGPALRKAILEDVRLSLESHESISSSVSQALRNLRTHCHPDDVAHIDAVLRLRQQSGRRARDVGAPK